MIDVHSHFITRDYYCFLKKHNALFEDGFPIPEWSIDDHLEMMKQTGISYSLLSVSSPQPYFRDDVDESVTICRSVNEQIASYRNQYPERIGFQAILPLPNVEASITEAKYVLDELHANGIKLASNSRGLYLGDPLLEPLMEVLNTRHAVCNIHPHRPEPLKEGIFSAGPVPLYEFLADTTRAVLNLISNGITEKYPNIKWIVPHCGSFLPNIYDRYKGVCKILVPKGMMKNVDVEKAVSSLYFDLAGMTSSHILDLLLSITTPEHILFGVDYPFTPLPMIKQFESMLISILDNRNDLVEYKRMILEENAKKLYRLK